MVQPPRDEGRKVEGIPPAQARALFEAIEQDRLGPLFTLALMTGMRQGELLGLRWRDVDLEQGFLHVRQTLKSLPGEPVFGPPKSASSRRFMPLDDLAEAALRTQKDRQTWERKQAGIAWQEWGGGLVFTRQDGRPLDSRSRRGGSNGWRRTRDLGTSRSTSSGTVSRR
jgi:integrase